MGGNPMMSNPMMGMTGMGGNTVDTRSPQERFKSELEMLKNMGFYNSEENIRVLTAAQGNVNVAVDHLLNSNF